MRRPNSQSHWDSTRVHNILINYISRLCTWASWKVGPCHHGTACSVGFNSDHNMCAERNIMIISFTSLLANAKRQMWRKAQRSGLHAVQWVGQFKTMGFINFYLYSGPHPATARQLILGGHTGQALVGFKPWAWSTAKQRRVTCSTQSASNLITLLNNAVLLRLYRVSQLEWTKRRECVPYVELYRHNPKHLYPKLNGYGDNDQRSLKLWQMLLTYWLPNTY